MNESEIDKIKRLLSDKRKIVIIPHKNPDGDAIGSSTALKYYLDNFNHNVDIISPNQFPEFLKWMDPNNIIKIFDENEKYSQKIIDAELIFTLDFNNLVRISGMKEYVEKSNAKIIMIDHHEEPSNYADFMYSEPKMSSTCEMIYHFIEKMGDVDKIDKNISKSLYAGIMTDTGSFKFPSTTELTHLVISNLLKTGISHSDIHNHIYDNNKFERVQLLSFALSKIKIIENLNTCYISLSQKELNKFNYEKGDTEGIVNYGLSIKNIKFAVIFMENSNDNVIRISLRSRGDFDVNQFSKNIFGGGGHKNAAGAISKKSLDNTINYFLDSLKNYKESLKSKHI
tara:strand:- start:1112 stop:2134 length:1023 start_codon:yes stop_codon:yes gene_type:complete